MTDIYRPLFNPQASQRQMLWIGRLLTSSFDPGSVHSPLIRVRFNSVFEAFQTYLSLFQGSLLALLLLGMLSKRVTQWGGLAGLLTGVLMAIYLQQRGTLFLWVAWWSFVAAMGGAIMVSWLTKPYDDQRLRGLVCWLPHDRSADDSAEEQGVG